MTLEREREREILRSNRSKLAQYLSLAILNNLLKILKSI